MSKIEHNQLHDVVSVTSENKNIQSLIYVLRGQQVMMDFDLAVIYGYEVKRLNEQVKRNKGRFPEDFMFQLTKDEIDLVKSQIATSPNANFFSGQEGGRRKMPYAFTEQGIYMLATVLKGEMAEQQSILIMRAFREMRRFFSNNVKIFTYPSAKLTNTDVVNFNAQYPMLTVKKTIVFHDRFLILDSKTVYHIGASLKDAGKKCFGLSRWDDQGLVSDLLKRLKTV